ncbi:hypothetical protein JXA40_01080 [bacterium]|nr:hypothetical protein [candidate division CSSED10-310 bacterium]
MKFRNVLNIGVACAFMVCSVFHANAEDMNPSESGIRYARMAIVSGDVTIQVSSEMDEQPARMNHPFLDGDRLVSGSDGAVEIQIDNGDTAWIYYNTKLDLTDLGFGENATSQITGLKLWVGDFAIRFREPADIGSRRYVDVNSGRFYLPRSGLIRIFQDSNGFMECHVRDGSVEFKQSGRIHTFQAGEAIQSDPVSDRMERMDLPEEDEFDEWVIERDKFLGGAYRTEGYIPDDHRGAYADLAGHGRWIFNVYLGGYCWVPYVSIGWTPYHYGYWSWIPGWGWTWIPDEPWGWTAYHYGYWAYYFEFGWMWVPHWRWGPHWASWRYHGRSVHWVPIHPRDDLDAEGRLRSGSVPKNSRLELGIPVEAGQNIEELINQVPVRSSRGLELMPDSTQWRNNPPEEITSQARQLYNSRDYRSHSRSIQRSQPDVRSYSGYGYLPLRSDQYRGPKDLRKRPVPAKQGEGSTIEPLQPGQREIKKPGNRSKKNTRIKLPEKTQKQNSGSNHLFQ